MFPDGIGAFKISSGRVLRMEVRARERVYPITCDFLLCARVLSTLVCNSSTCTCHRLYSARTAQRPPSSNRALGDPCPHIALPLAFDTGMHAPYLAQKGKVPVLKMRVRPPPLSTHTHKLLYRIIDALDHITSHGASSQHPPNFAPVCSLASNCPWSVPVGGRRVVGLSRTIHA